VTVKLAKNAEEQAVLQDRLATPLISTRYHAMEMETAQKRLNAMKITASLCNVAG
jgi:hypothetical protein